VGVLVALALNYLLGRLAIGRIAHGILAAIALVAAFAINEYLLPWNSQSLWLKLLVPCLASLAGVELCRAFTVRGNRNAV